MKSLPTFSRTLTVAAVCGLFAAVASAQQIQINKDNRTIAITATDSASTLADTATVHVGFVAYAPDAQAAYAAGSKISNAIVGALTAKGVAKDAIQSESQSVAETQHYELEKLPPAEQAQRRFHVRQSWTVQTKADEAAGVLNTAVNAGANQSGQIDWTVADEKALEAKAAGNALARARAIASQMAQGLGIQLVIDLCQQSGPGDSATDDADAGRGRSDRRNSRSRAAPAPLAINARKVERSATVYAVFSIQ